eukprot:scaffold2375_cov361-Pinguiococcus_pyrenoidosus.AAC.3
MPRLLWTWEELQRPLEGNRRARAQDALLRGRELSTLDALRLLHVLVAPFCCQLLLCVIRRGPPQQLGDRPNPRQRRQREVTPLRQRAVVWIGALQYHEDLGYRARVLICFRQLQRESAPHGLDYANNVLGEALLRPMIKPA